MSTELKERKRRPAARNAHVVIGAIEENARMFTDAPTIGSRSDEFIAQRGNRIIELIDELRRSLGKDGDVE